MSDVEQKMYRKSSCKKFISNPELWIRYCRPAYIYIVVSIVCVWPIYI
jgi:hypothetical protein